MQQGSLVDEHGCPRDIDAEQAKREAGDGPVRMPLVRSRNLYLSFHLEPKQWDVVQRVFSAAPVSESEEETLARVCREWMETRTRPGEVNVKGRLLG